MTGEAGGHILHTTMVTTMRPWRTLPALSRASLARMMAFSELCPLGSTRRHQAFVGASLLSLPALGRWRARHAPPAQGLGCHQQAISAVLSPS
jgi:hypothetical protein